MYPRITPPDLPSPGGAYFWWQGEEMPLLDKEGLGRWFLIMSFLF
jgi:hypothetical protein